ncbi:LPS-assembly protein LptD [Algibacillus agarilyticus]|uniref:LPS-assembly protein LptD n=1 Tax=Algibacillus agarilyticus TaxID=2234133 RepID=UPI000DCFE810|nr:LPS assembly protein LptD [Algibacillus agarilyticus]
MALFKEARTSIAAICLSIFSVSALAVDEPSCYSAIDAFSVPAANDTAQEKAIVKSLSLDSLVIEADSMTMQADGGAEFTGQVEVIQGGQKITANKASTSENRDVFVADGGVEFIGSNVKVNSESVTADMLNKSLIFTNSRYVLAQNVGHGNATELNVSESAKGVTLLDATFTTCPDHKNPEWELEASEIFLSADDERGEAWHSRFNVMGVPVLYIPYVSFPLTDKRKSGFLLPSIGSSSQHGLDIEQPYYWNIAPNIDATTSVRLMTNRGAMLKAEGRYLHQSGKSDLNVEWLGNDNDSRYNDSRSAVAFNYQGQAFGDWHTYVDLHSFSDDRYLSDFGFKNLNRVDTHVESIVSLYQLQKDWSLLVNVRQFEVFGDHLRPFRTLPEVKFEYFPALNIQNTSLSIPAEFAYFDTAEETRANAYRLHTQPTLKWQLNRPAWELGAEGSILATAYRQQTLDRSEYKNITRVLPRVRLNGRVIFERPLDWFGKPMTQTFEPKMQYLWVPEHDQSDIRFYDSTLLQDDFHGLFRVSRYSGVDRILEANQVTLGASSRLINDRNQEKLQVSIGQIFYLDDPKIEIVDEEDGQTRGKSAVAFDLAADIRKRWFLHYGLQYDTELKHTNKSQFTLDYRLDEGHFVQFSHRYARRVSDSRINMTGILAQWEVNKNWQLFSSYYHDFALSRNLESKIGVQYQSCCWGIQFSWQSRLLSDIETDDSNSTLLNNEYDRGFLLRFSTGLGSQSDSTTNLLQDGTFGYRRPYFLNQ